MKIFTSDLHHEHKKIVEFTNRKLATTQEEHTDWLRDTWNRQVQNSDLVFHLGDFSFSKDYNTILEFVKSLKGQKIFVKGNHCDSKILTRLVQDNAIAKWCYYDSTKIAGQHVCLFHFPMACWDRQGYGSWHLHGHCVDLKTEVLTSEGWKYRQDINIGDTVFSYNPVNSSIEEDSIQGIVDNSYTGKVYVYEGKSVNFRVTGNHRVVGYSSSTNKYVEHTAEKFPSVLKAVVSGYLNNSGVELTNDLLKLYILIAADGSIKNETSLVRIRIKKKHKISYVRDLLSKLRIKTNEHTSNDYVSFNFYIPDELLGWTFKGLDLKLLSANRLNCESIIEAYCHSDGYNQPNGVIIYSAKEIEIDLLQNIFVLNGFMCTKYSRYHGFSKKIQYQLSVTDNQRQILKRKNLRCEDVINEKFWCISTRNGNFLCRREGKVHLTGNSHGGYQTEGKILDVGIDNAYNVFGEHKFFTEEDIVEYMGKRSKVVKDQHKDR